MTCFVHVCCWYDFATFCKTSGETVNPAQVELDSRDVILIPQ